MHLTHTPELLLILNPFVADRMMRMSSMKRLIWEAIKSRYGLGSQSGTWVYLFPCYYTQVADRYFLTPPTPPPPPRRNSGRDGWRRTVAEMDGEEAGGAIQSLHLWQSPQERIVSTADFENVADVATILG